MSPITVLVLVFALAVLAVVMFIAVVAGIRSEPRRLMTTEAHRPLAAIVRRLLGVYVGKPADANADAGDREKCAAGPSTDWRNNGGATR